MTQIPFDIVGFDLDGTLFDTSADLAAAVNHALGIIGRPPFAADEVKPFIGRGARVMLDRALVASGGSSPELLDELHPLLLEYYGRNLTRFTAPYSGLIPAMETLRARGVRLAVCTNKVERFAVPLIEALGLSPFFASIVGGDTVGVGKPDPAPIRAMIERAGGGRCVFVGDTTNDINSAKNAGVASIAVSFGFPDRPVHSLGADAIIDHFDELVPLLERWPT